MRREVKIIEKPSLAVHICYDHITVGELGNILIRLQAALRSMAGLSPGKYDERYSYAQPRFITSSVSTKKSIDIAVLLAVLSIAMQAPNAIDEWRRLSTEVFQRFKIAVLALSRGDIEAPEAQEKPDTLEYGWREILPPESSRKLLRVEVTRGKIDIELHRPWLEELSNMQRRRLWNFLWSLTGPARSAEISDDESEISIKWPEEDKGSE